MARRGRITLDEAYEVYKTQYLQNVRRFEKKGMVDHAEKLRDKMATKAEFNASINDVRLRWKQEHPTSHGESLDRLGKFLANKETRQKSSKQVQVIKKVANILGIKITAGDIYYGSMDKFKKALKEAEELGLIDSIGVWEAGSP